MVMALQQFTAYALATIAMAFGSSHLQEHPCLTITAAKERIVAYEPLNLWITFQSQEEAYPVWELYVDNVLIEKSDEDDRWRANVILPRTTHIQQKGDRHATSFPIMIFFSFRGEKQNFVFEKAGTYEIVVKERHSGNSSNKLTIAVDEPAPAEGECIKLLTGDKAYIPLMSIGSLDFSGANRIDSKTLDVYKTIVEKYPNSPFAPYASHILGVHTYYQEESKASHAKDLQEFHSIRDEYRKTVVTLLRPAIASPERSILQEEALFIAMKCCGRVQNHEETEKYFRMLMENYPYGIHAATARAMAKGEKSLEAIIEEVENARKRDSE